MKNYSSATYGDRAAESYDRFLTIPEAQTRAAVERLAELGDPGPILELGIGTGRLALPLAARGLEVRGIDASQAMIDALRAKPGGEKIDVVCADFTDVPIDGNYELVFVAFNTFFGLLTQDEQVRCFQSVAKRLSVRGQFLVEAFVPDTSRYDRGQRIQVASLDLDGVKLDCSVHDAPAQRVTSRQIIFTGEGIVHVPIVLRYAWPSELDLMARLAGLRLHERWSSWSGEPFTAGSGSHISVYGREQ